MMLTKDQAAATWCPMVRGVRHEVVRDERPLSGGLMSVSEDHHIVAGCNTDAIGRNRVPASCRCIADGCAMWRWLPPEDYDGHERRGYCGLAGAPIGGAL